MDALVILIVGLYLYLVNNTKQSTISTTDGLEERPVRTNPEFLRESDPFMEVAHELGF